MVTKKIGQKKYLLLILCWKLMLWHKIKDLNGETIIGFFNEKSICWVKNGVSVLRTVF